MKGDQFKPIDKPYLEFWREDLTAEQVSDGLKRLKLKSNRVRKDKELDKVVAQMKKGKLPKRKK